MTLLRALLSALFVLQGLAAFQPGPALWGLHHLAYLPPALRPWPPLIGLALLWSPAGERFGAWLGRRVAPMIFDRRWVLYGLVPLLGAGLFWVLRVRTHFLGDGWLLGELVHRGVLFHGFDFVGYHLHARLYQALGWHGEAQAFLLFALVSLFAGWLHLIAVGWAARRWSGDPGERLLLYLLLVACASSLVFCGYVEAYALLVVALALFALLVAAHYATGVPAWVAGVAFGAALAMHLDALFLAPLLLLLALQPAQRRSGRVRHALALGLPAAAGFLAGVAILHLGGYHAGWLELEFLRPEGRPQILREAGGPEGWLQARHLKDVANLLVLLAGTPLAMIAAALVERLRARRREGQVPWLARGEAVLLAGCSWVVLLAVALHLRLGMARDWDLFAAPAAVFPAAALLLWRGRGGERERRRLLGWVGGAALLLALPWFWVNAGEERSLRRFESVVADLPPFARAYALEEIGKYHRKADRDEEALAAYRACVEIFPGNPRFRGALGALLYDRGDLAGAEAELLRVVAADTSIVEAPFLLAMIAADRGDFPAALDWSRRIAGSAREPARAAALHGAVAEELGFDLEAIAAYRRAAAGEEGRGDLLERAGLLALRGGDLAQAEGLLRAVLAREPRREATLAGLLEAGRQRLLRAPPRPGDEEALRRVREQLALVAALEQSGQASAELRAWREQLRRWEEQLTGSAAGR